MLKRILCILLALMLPCAALAEYAMAGYDPENTYRTWSTNLFFARMQEKTGITFTYQQYTDIAKWTAAKAAMEKGGELPDVLFKAELTPAECMDLLDKGVLVDLKPYLESCCPNLYALLQAQPEFWDAITLPDGCVAALPYISEQPMQNCVWLNSQWLGNLKLPMPATVEELTDTLRAFRDNDPNRNGKKDEIPLAFLGAFDLKFLGHAFGLTANDYNLYAKDGKAYFMPLDEQFRPFVEWLRLLFSEGLLDVEGFSTSDTLRAVTDEKKTNVYGGAITTMMTTFLPGAWINAYAVMPPIAFNGQASYRSFMGAVMSGTFAVTTACENVEEILGWIDLFYTEEISLLGTVGQQNIDYLVDGDGTWRMTESASSNSYFTGDTLITSGGTAPGVSSDAFQRMYTDGTVRYVSEQVSLVNAVAARPFPYFALTAAQEKEIAPLQAAIGRLVDESIARWVTGETPITDESFAAFEKELNTYDLPAFMAFWQNILDGRTAP